MKYSNTGKRILYLENGQGRPIIAGNQGGPAEALDDGRTGFLCRPGDVHGLASEILGRIDNPIGAKRTARPQKESHGNVMLSKIMPAI